MNGLNKRKSAIFALFNGFLCTQESISSQNLLFKQDTTCKHFCEQETTVFFFVLFFFFVVFFLFVILYENEGPLTETMQSAHFLAGCLSFYDFS